MNRSQKIALAVSGLVVAGLVAVAAPAVSALMPAPAAAPAPVAVGAVGTADPDAGVNGSAAGDEEAVITLDDGRGAFSAQGPGNCTTNSVITTPWHESGTDDPVELVGELVDMGESSVAAGPVGLNAEGLIESYTVVSGDSLIGIGERFCIDFVTVGVYNDRFGAKQIQPGDVLVLRPDPTAPWRHPSD
ncbi:hypothetical protein [Microbacterium sp. NPDC087665]|uniref:LysM peptidoglycan-binding domain-containing protein n=1 Tax=Microbacterium sp. NPDC087665 TaxID=3364194 RepID=UPI0037FC46AC